MIRDIIKIGNLENVKASNLRILCPNCKEFDTVLVFRVVHTVNGGTKTSNYMARCKQCKCVFEIKTPRRPC